VKLAKDMVQTCLVFGGEHSHGSAALTSMKSLATNVRGGIVPFSGHWIAEERPDFLIKGLRVGYEQTTWNYL
jgi:hypothetical protein